MVTVRYDFHIISGRMTTPESFAKEAERIAVEFFGDRVGVEIMVEVRGTSDGYQGDCVATREVSSRVKQPEAATDWANPNHAYLDDGSGKCRWCECTALHSIHNEPYGTPERETT